MIKWLLLLLVIVPLWGQTDSIYKWIDKKGVVHFSSKPHPEAEDVETLKTPELPRMIETPTDQEATNSDETAQAAEEVADNQRPTPEQIEYCKILKSNLKTLRGSLRVRMKKANGEFDILGDEARQSEIDRIEKAIKESC